MPHQEIAGPFRASGNWYRGCLHAHTAESDGWMPPDRLVAHYREAGYDFIALTDHEKLTDRTTLSAAEYLVLRGIEVASGRTELGERFHVVGIGVEGPISLEEAREMTAQQTIDAIHRLGGEAIVAHPYWSGLTAADLMGLSGYIATEVFNTTCQTSIGRGRSDYVWDEVLTRGRLLRAVASDDCHRPGVDSRRAWTMVRATALTPPAVLEALRRGHFYASTGPVIRDVRLEGDVVEVDCSPVQAVELICDPTRGQRVAAGAGADAYGASRKRPDQLREGVRDGDLLTGATFQLRRQPRYARVQVVDPAGRMAWTGPLFMEG